MEHLKEFAETVRVLNSPEPRRKTGWASMNRIQKTGIISFGVLFAVGLFIENLMGFYLSLAAWTVIVAGYVAGGLWKFRHVVPFRRSLAAASLAHLCFLPAYAKIVHLQRAVSAREGKVYAYLAFGLAITEILVLLYVIKRFALQFRKKGTHGR